MIYSLQMFTRWTSSLSRSTSPSTPRRTRSRPSHLSVFTGKDIIPAECFWNSSKLKCSRNGGLLIYDGKLDNAMSLLKWLTDLENLKIDGRIEEVMTWESMQGRIQFYIFYIWTEWKCAEKGNEGRKDKRQIWNMI